MKLPFIAFYIFLIGVLASFKPNQACQYAGSNIGYVKAQTEQAIAEADLQLARFHTFKAINAIEKSKEQLEDCGCERAVENISEGSEHLRNAVKATTLASLRMLLEMALGETIEGLNALENHEKHTSTYGNDLLTLNTKQPTKNELSRPPGEMEMKQKIDSSLQKYRKSLDNVINTVGCKKAKSFAKTVYDNCSQELLKPNLSEGKKYYNLRTQQITAEALAKLGNCSEPN